MIRQAKPAGSVENDPGCVKTLGGITAPGILGSTVMRRAKKRKNLSSARHYDQIRFRFHTTKTQDGHGHIRPPGRNSGRLRKVAKTYGARLTTISRIELPQLLAHSRIS